MIDLAAYLLSSSLLLADWRQAHYIRQSPYHQETNLVLGRDPTRRQVNAYFGTLMAANAAVFFLPKEKRKIAWGAVIIYQAVSIATNKSIGVKIIY